MHAHALPIAEGPGRLDREGGSRQGGFTLTELAIVLLIVALLIGGLLPTVSSQIESRRISDTQKAMAEIKEALIGFAVINKRLPCPANPAVSDPSNANYGTEDCGYSGEGWLPWKTLGVSEIDAWGQHRSAAGDPVLGFWRYRVDTNFKAVFLLTTAPSDNLSIQDSNGNPLTAATEPPVAIVFSTGADRQANGENAIPNTIYQAGEITSSFDDIMIWISRPVLFNRMVAAGKLP